MGADPEIVVEADADTLAAAVAERVVSTLTAALAAQDVAHLAITGGGILEQSMRALAAAPGAVDWARVHVWWGDERYVPTDSDDRNEKAARAALLDALPLDPAKVHPMPAADAGYADVEAAAAAYAEELAGLAADGDVPAFDAVLLGLGPDGHCASLFPGQPGVYVEDAAVIAVHDSPKPPPTRISLTFPTLDAGKQVWLIASGDGKAEAVGRAFSGLGRDQVPASGPRGLDRTLWLIDRAAAADLPPSVHPSAGSAT